ncbi:nicotinate phosphoribosyltransferase, partial [Enterococcus faecalis]|nr:nicotinate phosphoribosyltransferase [Enterococcus faecalis]
QGNFDIFFRKAPNSSSFVVNAGLSTALTELKNFHFSKEDLAYLESLSIFNEKFIAYLAAFEYNCKLTVIPEGCPVFPLEPIVSIQGPIVQLQLFETMLLNILGHQSLIATTARRMVMAADGKPIIDFGARRAQGPDGAIFGTRAAIIGGVKSTTNVLAAKAFDLPIVGTMAHSWVQSFPNEKTAFKVWAQLYPNALSFLVDTYDVLESGIPNAIDVFKSLDKSVADSWSIRIDSGDLAMLVTKSRILLDEAGLQKVKITVSNSLNILDIQSLTKSNIPIDNFGVGENLIVSTSSPVLGMVYKLSAILENKQVVPKIKKSNSSEKTTLPGIKKV